MQPDISVVIPALNEGGRLAETIGAIAAARTTRARVEFVVADDASIDDTEQHLRAAWPMLENEPAIDVRVSRLAERGGVPRARNHAVSLATADVLFITDAHVRFSSGWDAQVFQHLRPDRVVAGAIAEAGTPFVGYGCRLVVPFMGTYWNKERIDHPSAVQIAGSAATVLARETFDRIGGYDDGMLRYGSAEPEFSVRAWLQGMEIVVVPDLQVTHRFKPVEERRAFIRSVRLDMVHNAIRFGLTYLSELGALQMLRYYARQFPDLFDNALELVSTSDVWDRRARLEAQMVHPFSWFIDRFGLRDHVGRPVL